MSAPAPGASASAPAATGEHATATGSAGVPRAPTLRATVGALLVLFIWNRLVAHRVLPGNSPDPSAPPRRWL